MQSFGGCYMYLIYKFPIIRSKKQTDHIKKFKIGHLNMVNYKYNKEHDKCKELILLIR